jgi:hypothetical protein
MHMGKKIQGAGSSNFYQNPWVKGQSFQDKIARGVPYFGFYCIFKNKFFWKFLWVELFYA